jgi:MFS family permease
MSAWTRTVGDVLRDRRLRLLVTAFLGFSMAENGVWVALLVYAYGLGGATAAAITALVQLIPSAIAAPLGAFAGDRFPRGRVLLAAYAVQSLTLLATTAALLLGAPPVLVVLIAAANSSSITFTRPTHYAILPDIATSAATLAGANAVSGLAEGLGLLVGSFVSGLVLAAWGPAAAFAVFGGVTAVAAAQIVGMRVASGAGPERPLTAGEVVRETIRGFAVLSTEPAVRLPIAVLTAMFVVVGGLEVLLVAVAIDVLHAGEGWAGYLSAAFGLGGIIGAAAAVSLAGRPRLTPALATGSIVFGGPVAAMGFVASLLAAPLLIAVAGIGRSVASVSGNTLLQRAAPPSALARVFGVLESLTMLSLAVGSLGASALVASVGITGALLVAGAVVPLTALALWRPLRAVERGARAPEPGLLDLVRSLPIFAPLAAPALERILASLERMEVPVGHVLMEEGAAGDRFYILAEGDVDVLHGGRRIAVVKGVDMLGEIALLRDVPRTATVVATTPLRLYALDREPFLEAVTGHPQARARAEQVADRRMAENA